MRSATVSRKTFETDIQLTLNLDGTGESDVSSGVGFLDHMLTLFACHGGFDLSVKCVGDKNVDFHHSIEDVGICLGDAFKKAIGDCRGITRYGDALIPMDEALALCALDVSGRGVLAYDLGELTEKVGDMDTEIVKEFFVAFTQHSGVTVHLKALSGENTHHKIEAGFKAFARSLRKAVTKTVLDVIPSSKGVI